MGAIGDQSGHRQGHGRRAPADDWRSGRAASGEADGLRQSARSVTCGPLMDLARILARLLFVYVVMQCMLRVSGKRTVKQGELASFVVALVLGDLFDDVLWAE